MSFFATLGVILMSEAAEGTLEGKGGFAAKLKKSVGSVAASVGAVMFVLPLQWLYFGEMSPMSVLATLLLSFLCEGMLILYIPSSITALVGFHYLAAPLAGIITAIYRICAFAADKLADISSLVSLRYPFAAPIIIICIAVIVVMMVKNVKNWLWSLIPFAAASVIFFGCVHIHDAVGCDKTVLNYINFEAHDAVAAVNGRRAVVFDMTDGAAKAMDSIRYTLSDNYVTEIDTYVLTDVSLRHIGALRNMLKYRVIHKVYIPMAQQENEIFYVSELMRTAKEYGAKAVLYSRSKETVMSIGDVRVTMPQHTELERSVKPLSALRFECGDEIVTYVGSSAWENEYVWDFTDNADSVIIGANGPVCKSSPEGKLPKTVKELYCPSEDVLKSLGKWVDRDRVSVKTLVRFVMTARN